MKTKEDGKRYIRWWTRLAEKLQKYPCLYEKRNKGYKERDREKNIWRIVEQFLIVFLWTIRDLAITWKAVHFSSLHACFYKQHVYNTVGVGFPPVCTSTSRQCDFWYCLRDVWVSWKNRWHLLIHVRLTAILKYYDAIVVTVTKILMTSENNALHIILKIIRCWLKLIKRL